jgi:outer membrane protein assembly factor BamE
MMAPTPAALHCTTHSVREIGLRLVLVLCLGSLVACSWLPRVHRVTVQQGNVISQEMVDRLKPGMTRRQVAFIMGEPVLRNSFDPERWDYVYFVRVPNFGEQQARVSLFFENDVLSSFSGDFAPSSMGAAMPAPQIEVPAEIEELTREEPLL